MSQSIGRNKSFAFAVRVVNLCKLVTTRKEFIMSKQLLRSATSVGANVREALNTQTKPDFIYKFSIAQKECDETIYWLEILKETKYIDEREFESMIRDASEILKIIRSIILTSKRNS